MNIYGQDDHDELFVIKACKRTGEQARHYKSNLGMCTCWVCRTCREVNKPNKKIAIAYPKGLNGMFKSDVTRVEKKSIDQLLKGVFK